MRYNNDAWSLRSDLHVYFYFETMSGQNKIENVSVTNFVPIMWPPPICCCIIRVFWRKSWFPRIRDPRTVWLTNHFRSFTVWTSHYGLHIPIQGRPVRGSLPCIVFWRTICCIFIWLCGPPGRFIWRSVKFYPYSHLLSNQNSVSWIKLSCGIHNLTRHWLTNHISAWFHWF